MVGVAVGLGVNQLLNAASHLLSEFITSTLICADQPAVRSVYCSINGIQTTGFCRVYFKLKLPREFVTDNLN